MKVVIPELSDEGMERSSRDREDAKIQRLNKLRAIAAEANRRVRREYKGNEKRNNASNEVH